jgi:methionyl-tRNA synthetase
MKNYSKTYITTSIPYINGKPHIGFAMELVQADALARFYRLFGREVFFSTGTDEHGLKIQQEAAKAGEKEEVYAAKIAKHFEDLARTMNISADAFIRTSTYPGHKEASQKIWQLVEKAGYLYKKTYEGLYCVGCERFYTEKEIIDGLCPIHKRPVEKVAEENWFFKLSAFSKEIEKRVTSGELRVVPEERKKEILNVISKGLEDISVSRSREKLTWGIPVPGDDSQIMYVWFDALTNYISVLGWGAENESLFKEFWKSEDSEVIHVIGKDIIRFHVAYWIGMLLAADLRLPSEIMIHGFVSSDGEKMSKSLGNVIDPQDVVAKYGVDATRYYVLSQIPTLADGDFSWHHFHEVYESHLKNGLGNLVNRITNIVEKKLGGEVSAQNIGKEFGFNFPHIQELLEKRDLKAITEEVRAKLTLCDELINKNELFKETEKKLEDVYAILSVLKQAAVILSPVLPRTATEIFKALNVENPTLADIQNNTKSDFSGVVKPAKPLFPPVEK